jgi:hypothetical protein
VSSLTIGVTGHRPNRLDSADAELLRARTREVLAAARGSHPDGNPPILRSALAEGADRIFAREAVGLGFRLEAVLPFQRTDYEKDFATTESLGEFRKLLARAESVRELSGSRGTPEARDAAYGALGRGLLDRADLLIAIWDGRRARGEGGTAEVLVQALEREIVVVWISAAPPHEVWLLTGEGDIAFDPERLGSSLRARRAPAPE